MAKRKVKISLNDKLREVEQKLKLIENENFILKQKWIRSPDHERNYRHPEKARISNWDLKEDFYNDYDNSDPAAKKQLFNMVKRLFLLTENYKYPFWKRTFSKKNFLLTLFYSCLSLWVTVLTISSWTLVLGKAQGQGNSAYIIMAVAFALLVGATLYILFKIIRFRWYKRSPFLQDYFGKWYSFHNPRFQFSNSEFVNQIINTNNATALKQFPRLFSEQDFLNFKTLFFREFYFFDAINPNYRYKSKYNFFSLQWQIVFWINFLAWVTTIVFIVLAILGIGA